MDAVEERDGLFHFVFLQVADQMKSRTGPYPGLQRGNRGILRFGFLHPVLAEILDTRFHHGGHLIRRARLGDRDQQDVGRISPRAAAGALHPVADSGDTRGDLHVLDDGRTSRYGPAKSVRVQPLYAREAWL